MKENKLKRFINEFESHCPSGIYKVGWDEIVSHLKDKQSSAFIPKRSVKIKNNLTKNNKR